MLNEQRDFCVSGRNVDVAGCLRLTGFFIYSSVCLFKDKLLRNLQRGRLVFSPELVIMHVFFFL